MKDDSTSEYADAKLREYLVGAIKDNDDLYPHTALVEPGSDVSELMSFIESVYDADGADLPPEFADSRAGRVLRRSAATDRVGASVSDLSSFAVGLTDADVEISGVQAFSRIQKSILNEGAPYLATIFGGMNKGKTGFAGLWLELWRELVPMKYDTDEYVVVTNMRTLDAADYVVTDIDSLRDLVFGDVEYFETAGESGEPPEIPQETPVWWHFDECSTHMDARTNAYEVASQYLPLVKRFAKVRVDGCHIAHSGMDLHADMRRDKISTEFIFKTALKTAEVYESMFEDKGSNMKYVLDEVPETSVSYDPDDFSPWSWSD